MIRYYKCEPWVWTLAAKTRLGKNWISASNPYIKNLITSFSITVNIYTPCFYCWLCSTFCGRKGRKQLTGITVSVFVGSAVWQERLRIAERFPCRYSCDWAALTDCVICPGGATVCLKGPNTEINHTLKKKAPSRCCCSCCSRKPPQADRTLDDHQSIFKMWPTTDIRTGSNDLLTAK